jgi:DNA-binding MarR family transcriptional regulator
MADDLHTLGEDLVSVSARVVRWAPKDGVSMSIASARILARLQDVGPTKISTLAAMERSSQPTITNHVQRLEVSGWVARGNDPTDARVSIISLTESGRAELRQMRDLLGTNVAPALAELSADDRQHLARGLEVMRKLLSQPPPSEPTAEAAAAPQK